MSPVQQHKTGKAGVFGLSALLAVCSQKRKESSVREEYCKRYSQKRVVIAHYVREERRNDCEHSLCGAKTYECSLRSRRLLAALAEEELPDVSLVFTLRRRMNARFARDECPLRSLAITYKPPKSFPTYHVS
jgi:hypothetical protein